MSKNCPMYTQFLDVARAQQLGMGTEEMIGKRHISGQLQAHADVALVGFRNVVHLKSR